MLRRKRISLLLIPLFVLVMSPPLSVQTGRRCTLVI